MGNKFLVRFFAFFVLVLCSFNFQPVSAAITVTLASTNGSCPSTGTVTVTVKYLTASDPEVLLASIKKTADVTWSPQQNYTTKTTSGASTILTFVFNNQTSGVYQAVAYNVNSGSTLSAATATVSNTTPAALSLNAPIIGNLTPSGCSDDGSISINSSQTTVTKPYTYHLYGGLTLHPDIVVDGKASNSVQFKGLATGGYYVSVTDGCGSTVSTQQSINVKSKYNVSGKTFVEFGLGGTTIWGTSNTSCGISFSRSLANVYLKDSEGNVVFQRSSGTEMPVFDPPAEGRLEYPAGSGNYTPWGDLRNYDIPESIYKPSVTSFRIQFKNPCDPTNIVSSPVYDLIFPFSMRASACGWEVYRLIPKFQCGDIKVKLQSKTNLSQTFEYTWDGSGDSYDLNLIDVPAGNYQVFITVANDTYQFKDGTKDYIVISDNALLDVGMLADVYNYTVDKGCSFTTGGIRVYKVPASNTTPITYTILSGPTPDQTISRAPVTSIGNLTIWNDLPEGVYQIQVDRGGCGKNVLKMELNLPFTRFEAEELTYTPSYTCGMYKIHGKGWYVTSDGSVSTSSNVYYGVSLFNVATDEYIGGLAGKVGTNMSFTSPQDLPAGDYRVSFSSTAPGAKSTCIYQDRYIKITDEVTALKFDGERSGGLVCAEESGEIHLEVTGGSGNEVKYRIKKKGDPDSNYSEWQISPNFPGLPIGEYTAQATDVCSSITQNFNLVGGNTNAKFDVQGKTIDKGGLTEVCEGSDVPISLIITGRASNIRWKCPDGTEIVSPTVNIDNFATKDIGTYISTYESGGCEWSDFVRVGMLPKPMFEYDDVAVCFPTTVNLKTLPLVSGDITGLTFKYYNSNNIELSNTVVSTVGTSTYKIVGTNSNGCSHTDYVDVTIHPIVTATLAGLSSVCVGSEETYTTDSGMSNYVWAISGGTITSGGSATDASVTVRWGTSTSGSVSVGYTSSTGCSTQSQTIQNITILPLVSIITQPVSQRDLCQGTALILSVSATGHGLSYQWYKNGTTIPGATNSTYVIASAQTSDSGNYYVIVTGTCNTVQSTSSAVTVSKPMFEYDDASVCAPSTVDLTALTLSSGDITGLTFKYYDSSNTELSNTVLSTVGAGTYKIVGTNTTGCSWTSTVTITIHPVVTATLSGLSPVCSGTEEIYSTEIGMSNYQWTVTGGSIVEGGTTTDATVKVHWGTGSSGSVSVGYTSSTGCSTQTPATKNVTIQSLADITTEPTSIVSLCQGSALSLSVTASGHGLSYQWYKNGTLIPGATNNSYSILSAQTTDSGNYYVIVTGTCNFVQSTTSAVSVTQPEFEYSGATVCAPSTVDLTALTLSSGDITGLTFKYYDSSDTELSNTVISALGTGTYKIVGTNSNGCSWTSTVTIIIHPVVTATLSGLSPVCSGAEEVYSTETGMSNYQWTINGGSIVEGGTSTDATIKVHWGTGSSGSVSVGYTSSTGCSTQTPATKNVTIQSLAAITTEPTSIVSLCQGSALSLSVTASGHGLSYQWYKNGTLIPGATNNSYSISSAQTTNSGNYYVIVTGTCNTVQSTTSAVTVSQPLFEYDDATVCSPSTVDLTTLSLSSGDITGLTLKYYDSNDTELSNTVISSVGTGTYKIVGTNSNGCSWTSTVTIIIHPVVTATLSGLSPVCSGAEEVYSTEIGMSNYQWTINGGSIVEGGTSTDATVKVHWGTGSSGSVSVGYTSSTGCSTQSPATKNVTIQSLAAITTEPTSIVSLCQGSALSLSVTASGHGLSYQWYKNGTLIPGATNNSYSISSAQTTDSGNYYVIVTGTCNFVQSATSAVSVTQPSFEYSGATVCAPSTVDLTALTLSSGDITGLTFKYYDSSDTELSNTVVSTVGTGTYKIVGTNSNGCSWTSTVTITIHPVVTGTLSGLSPVCSGAEEVYSTEIGMSNYQWTINGGNIVEGGTTTDATVKVHWGTGSSGNVSVGYTSSTGCSTQTPATKNVTIQSLAAITTEPTSIVSLCQGSALSLSVTASGHGLSYQWYKNGTLIPGATNNSYSISSAQTTDSGNYYVIVTGTCNFVQSTTSAVSITQPAFEYSGATVCAPSTVDLTALTLSSGDITGLTFKYYDSSDTELSNTVISTVGIGTYKIVGTNTTGCSWTSTVTITIHPVVTGTLSGLSPVCSGTEEVYSTEIGMSNYQWTINGGSIVEGGTSTDATVKVHWGTGSSGSVSVGYTSSTGCSTQSPATKSVTIQSLAAITTEPTSIVSLCLGSTLNLSTIATGHGLNYQWYKNGTLIPGATNNSYSIYSAQITDSGDYYVIVTGTCNFVQSTTSAVSVTQPEFEYSGATVCAPSTVDLTTLSLSSGDITGLTFKYYDSNDTELSNTVISSVGTGTYKIVGTNSNGCSWTSTVEVTIAKNPEPVIAGPVVVYTGVEYIYQGNGESDASNYYWETGNGNIISGQGTNESVISWDAPGNDIITLTYNYGVCQGTSTLNVEILSSGKNNTADFSINNSIQCLSDNTYSFTNTTEITPPNELVSYLWNFGDGSTSTEANPIHKYTKGGNYVVTLIAYGTLANDTISKTVKILAPMVERPADQVVCVNYPTEEILLKGSADSYSWKGGSEIGLPDGRDKVRIPSFIAKNNTGVSVTDTIIVTPMLMINDLVCYGDTTSFRITVNSVIKPTITGDDAACADSEVTYFTESGMSNYEWVVNGGQIISGGKSSDNFVTVRWNSSGNGSVSVNYAGKTACQSSQPASKIVTIYPKIQIISHPVSEQVLCSGEPLNLNVDASGSGLTYQWYLDGKLIDGACKSDYCITDCKPVNSGQYQVKVTGACNSILSDVASVSIGLQDVVVQKWENVLAVKCVPSENGGYEFASFQWYKNGDQMQGETKSYLYVSGVIDYSAVYVVKLTTKAGSVFYTCGRSFIPKNDILVVASPNPVGKGQMLNVDITGISNNTAVDWILMDYKGLVLQRQPLKGNHTTITMPNIPGIYILRVNIASPQPESKYFKLIVN